MNFETVKGTEDFEPKKQIQFNGVVKLLSGEFEKFGFRPFDTPIFEYYDTLTLKYDDDTEIAQEIYQLQDRGNRKLGLRYDLTTPLCRYVASKPQLKKPFRRYHIGKAFRDGPLKKGRMREFYQCDCDVVGEDSIEIEAELLSLFYSSFTKLGIDSVIELNNNKVLRGSLLQSGAEEKDLSSYILSIDKLKKIKKDGVLKELEEKELNKKVGEKALTLLSCKTLSELKKLAKNDLLLQGIKELEELTSYLTILKVNFNLQFSLSRGLDIYTGSIWEAYDTTKTVTSSIGSGGRYDKVIGQYAQGKGDNKRNEKGEKKENTPAVGISFGLVPILSCLEHKDSKEGVTDVLIVPLDKEISIEAQKLANNLRNSTQKNIEIYYAYSMKKAFKYCDYLGVEEVVFLGKRDIDSKKYVLKNLKSKESKEFDL